MPYPQARSEFRYRPVPLSSCTLRPHPPHKEVFGRREQVPNTSLRHPCADSNILISLIPTGSPHRSSTSHYSSATLKKIRGTLDVKNLAVFFSRIAWLCSSLLTLHCVAVPCLALLCIALRRSASLRWASHRIASHRCAAAVAGAVAVLCFVSFRFVLFDLALPCLACLALASGGTLRRRATGGTAGVAVHCPAA